MKKILFSIAALAVAFGFTACSSEDEAPNNVKDGKTTVMAMTETGTRTALADDGEGAYDVVWSDSDKITIGGKEFTLTEGEGKTLAKFTGTALADGSYTAYYATTDGNVPTKQVYKEGAISNFPMTATATVTDGNISPLSFRNVGGLLQLTVTNNSSKSYKLQVSHSMLPGLQNLTHLFVKTSNGRSLMTKSCSTSHFLRVNIPMLSSHSMTLNTAPA